MIIAKDKKDETGSPKIELLPSFIKDSILSFFGDTLGKKKFKPLYYSKKQEKQISFNHNINVLIEKHAELIAHNLLWQIDLEETLKLAAQHPESLLNVVEIKDPYGQRIRGTPLQIVYAAGDRNTREMKPEEIQYGLVERLRPCFKNLNVYDDQLKAWDISKEASENTMASYRKAIETLCQKIIESKDISDAVAFEKLLTLPMVEEFRKSLTPDSNHVVTSGFLFDMQIFLDFFVIWEAYINNDKVEDKKRANLKGRISLQSHLFAAIVYPVLQARCERCDHAIFKKGIGKVADGQIPDRLDYSKGTPADLKGIGTSHFFGFFGNKYGVCLPAVYCLTLSPIDSIKDWFETCAKQKPHPLELCSPSKVTQLGHYRKL